MLTHCIDSRWKQTRFTSASPNEHEGSTTRSPFKKWLTLGPKIGRTFGLCTTHQILPARSTFRETLTIEGKTRSSLQASTTGICGSPTRPGRMLSKSPHARKVSPSNGIITPYSSFTRVVLCTQAKLLYTLMEACDGYVGRPFKKAHCSFHLKWACLYKAAFIQGEKLSCCSHSRRTFP